jgi:hypothetical protein
MGHSFVEFRDQTQMMHDIEIVTVVHAILDATRKTSGSPQLTDNIKALLNSWSTIIDTYGPGCLDIDLNQFVRTDADRDCMLRLIECSRSMIQRFGSTVPGDYLNRIVGAPGVLKFVDRPTADVLVAFDKFIELLSDNRG